jgi:hypothetical protein
MAHRDCDNGYKLYAKLVTFCQARKVSKEIQATAAERAMSLLPLSLMLEEREIFSLSPPPYGLFSFLPL